MSKTDFVTMAIRKADQELLREIADQESRSMAQQVSYWIKQYLQEKYKKAV